MRILVIGDLHLDIWARAGRDPLASVVPVFRKIDALVIAGDLASQPGWRSALTWIRSLIAPDRVYILPGNHDYYLAGLHREAEMQALVESYGMHFVQKSELIFGDLRLLVCTLWTDYALTGERDMAMKIAHAVMTDFRQILTDHGLARPSDVLAVHEDHLRWLTAKLSKAFDGRTIVITHHCPSPSACGTVDDITPSFASDLDHLITRYQPDAWLFGHTHRHLASQVGTSPVVNVSLGYPDDVRQEQETNVLMRGLLDTDKPNLLVNEPR